MEERKGGIMATGKKALDIFAPTTGKKGDIGGQVKERIQGRPGAPEPYQKVTVTLYDRQILHLDKAAGALDPEGKDLEKEIRELFPDILTPR